MSRAATTIRRWTLRLHRWMGNVFCALFFTWFTSGMVMMYWSFPEVESGDRLARASALDPVAVRVSPEQALTTAGLQEAPSAVRVNLLDGRPVYRFRFAGGWTLVYADTGARLGTISQSMARGIAAAWTGFPADAASLEGLVTVDQWTVPSSVRPYAPFWKYAWPDGEEVYVSQSTGEVMQATTRRARVEAYFGAIPHWLYFASLRKQTGLWSTVVKCLSGAGAVAAILGLVAGVWLYSPSKRLPYRGQRRWHVILGLIFGTFACTWVFSGFLSMEPFAWLSDSDPPNLERALSGDRLDLGKFAALGPAEAMARAEPGVQVKELELVSFGGAAFYLAAESTQKSRLIPMRDDAEEALDTAQILAAVRRAVSPAAIVSTRLVERYESYYVDRWKQLPLPVRYVELNDSGRSAYYIDPRSGRVVQSYGTRSRWNRWLYHGLHSMDLPWLYAHRPAWDVVVIGLLLGGISLSVTSLLLAGKALRRTLR